MMEVGKIGLQPRGMCMCKPFRTRQMRESVLLVAGCTLLRRRGVTVDMEARARLALCRLRRTLSIDSLRVFGLCLAQLDDVDEWWSWFHVFRLGDALSGAG